ncbi:hypothetical protein [Deinococcus gobiensis]|uniref:hypothetical protein n=1 Tax=Deinococcus gobiensis TaxID=502394 RepID=UPI00031F886F|nr:hypothetical protein [Deinococcus gobiensis]
MALTLLPLRPTPAQQAQKRATQLASALPRPLDLTVASNRYAAAGLAVGTLAPLLLGRGWKAALGTGMAGFSAWATARELDPDHPQTAAVALPVAAAAALLGGAPNLLGSLTAVSSLRVLSATVGHRPSQNDLLALGVQAALSAFAGQRAAALLPGAALSLAADAGDRFAPAPEAALYGVAAGVLPPTLHRQEKDSKEKGTDRADQKAPPKKASDRGVLTDLLSLAALGLSQSLAAPETVRSGCDLVPTTVSAQRVQRSRQLALGALGLGLLLRESRGLAPLAAATLAVGLRRSGALDAATPKS